MKKEISYEAIENSGLTIKTKFFWNGENFTTRETYFNDVIDVQVEFLKAAKFLVAENNFISISILQGTAAQYYNFSIK